MAELEVIEAPGICEPQERAHPRLNDSLRSGLALLAIVALLCSSLELEFLERLDGMSQYMTLGETLCDASVALLVLIGLAILWWLCLLLLVQTTSLVPWMKRHRIFVFWRLGLSVPL